MVWLWGCGMEMNKTVIFKSLVGQIIIKLQRLIVLKNDIIKSNFAIVLSDTLLFTLSDDRDR